MEKNMVITLKVKRQIFLEEEEEEEEKQEK